MYLSLTVVVQYNADRILVTCSLIMGQGPRRFNSRRIAPNETPSPRSGLAYYNTIYRQKDMLPERGPNHYVSFREFLALLSGLKPDPSQTDEGDCSMIPHLP